MNKSLQSYITTYEAMTYHRHGFPEPWQEAGNNNSPRPLAARCYGVDGRFELGSTFLGGVGLCMNEGVASKLLNGKHQA